jgi:hypothetical protein
VIGFGTRDHRGSTFIDNHTELNLQRNADSCAGPDLSTINAIRSKINYSRDRFDDLSDDMQNSTVWIALVRRCGITFRFCKRREWKFGKRSAHGLFMRSVSGQICPSTSKSIASEPN